MCRCRYYQVHSAVAWCALDCYFLFFSNGRRRLLPFLEFHLPTPAVGQNQHQKRIIDIHGTIQVKKLCGKSIAVFCPVQ